MELETEFCEESETQTTPPPPQGFQTTPAWFPAPGVRDTTCPPPTRGCAARGSRAAGAVSGDFSDCPEKQDRGQKQQLQSQGGAQETTP